MLSVAACDSTVEGQGDQENIAGPGSGSGGVGGLGGTGGGTVSEGPPTPGPSLPAPLACSEEQITARMEEAATFDTTSGEDDFNASCFAGDGNDVAIEFIAPATDYYRFDTAGSDYETALALLGDSCDGDELACTADPSEPQVELIERVQEGERVLLVVDGKLGATGEAAVRIDRVQCPRLDLTDQNFPVRLTTANQGDDFQSSCGGDGTSDREVRWMAPAAGLYRFQATAEDFGAILSVHEGAACGGHELGCGFTESGGRTAEVVRRLGGGQVVTLVVDGGSGEFDLSVDDISESADCDGSGSGIVVDGFWPERTESFAGATHLHSGSCSPTGETNAIAAYEEVSEVVFPVTVDLAGALGCSIQIESDAPFSAYLLLRQDCSAGEFRCTREEGSPYFHSFIFTAADNGDYLLVVEDIEGLEGEFTLSTACVI